MSFLQRHPFPVRAYFDRAVAFSFAFPENLLSSLLPRGLELDTFEGMGFITVALVWTRHLRMAGLPKWLGQDFLLAGYRIFARLHEDGGRKLRGLKIIRSETDKKRMAIVGNLFTGYHYDHVRARMERNADVDRVQTWNPSSGKRNLDLAFRIRDDAALPSGSPFKDWRTARQFAGPMPFTFSSRPDGSFVVVEGVRTNWTPRPVEVVDWEIALFKDEPFCRAVPVLANAFVVEGIDYRWKRGRLTNAAV
jgi:uncharacterized protein YqjF (DUF2071 family)